MPVERLVSKISEIRRRAEALLDNDFELNQKEKKDMQKTFEVSRDLSLIRGISAGLPEDHLDRVVVLFSKMSLFFEAGVMMENQDGSWTAQAVFDRGAIETIKSPQKKSMRLPHIEILSVLRTPASPILEKLQLTHLNPDNQLQCLLIKISADFSFLLLSKLPDLWLKDHLQNIKLSLQNGIAD